MISANLFDRIRTLLVTSTASGVDIATIALWLGHESITTTQIYQHADPALKEAEAAIARTAPLGAKPGRYRPADQLLAFLEEL
jgi:integrase/recombinase XerD